jgi:phosphate transport system protein
MSLAGAPLPTSTLERLVPIAEGIEAFTRSSGRAFVDQNATLARSLMANGGERQRIASELDAAMAELLSGAGTPSRGVSAGVRLMVSLGDIADLAATICARVAELGDRVHRPSQPAMDRLAHMVPDMVKDAVSALRAGNRESAELVLRQGFTADTCFAQTQSEVLQLIRQNTANLQVAQELHAINRAFERIGDGATEIADRVRAAAVS